MKDAPVADTAKKDEFDPSTMTLYELRKELSKELEKLSYEFREIAKPLFITSTQKRMDDARSNEYRDHTYQKEKLKFIVLLLDILDNPKPKQTDDTENQSRTWFQKLFSCWFEASSDDQMKRKNIRKLQDQLKKLLIKVNKDKINDDKKKKNKNDKGNISDNFDDKQNRDFDEEINTILTQELKDNSEPPDKTIKKFEKWSSVESTNYLREIIKEISKREINKTIKDPPSIKSIPKLTPIIETMLLYSPEFMPYLQVLLINLKVVNQHFGFELRTPLHFAVITRNLPFLKWLLEVKDIDINSRNFKSQTPLYLLCEQWRNINKKNKIPFIDEESNTASLVREYILLLLDHGADLNVWGGELPLNLLRQHTDTVQGKSLIEECKAKFASAVAEIKVEKIGNDKRRLVKFDDTDGDKDMKWTVELLEVLLRIHDQEGFETQFKQFKIDENNIRMVIKLLLRTAVQEGLDDSVNLIVSICGKEEEKGNKINIFYETDETNENKEFHLAYRREWRGILRSLCMNGNDTLLPLFLERMNDRLLINDEHLLIPTLNKAKQMLNKAKNEKDKSKWTKLMNCAKTLVNNPKIHITARDNSGNTALHVALKHDFEDIAWEILKQPYAFIGIRNHQGLTPISYGSHDFWNKYFDQCIVKKNREDIFIDFHSISPFIIKRKKMFIPSSEKRIHNQTTNQAKNMHTIGVRRQTVSNKFAMNVKIKNAEGNKNSKPRESDHIFKKINEMDAIVEIAKSDKHQRLLLHPMLYTFIATKWSRINGWNWINLILSFGIAALFAWHSMLLHYYDIESLLLLVLCYVGFGYQLVREILQIMFLRWDYLKTPANYLDLFIITFMLLALLNIDYSVNFCSMTLIGFPIQLAQMYGSIRFGEVSSYIYMFQTVTWNFVKCTAMFWLYFPTFGIVFAIAFKNTSGNFASFWTSSVSIMTMTSGEFNAQDMKLDGLRAVIFILFIYLISTVLMSLFNGIAVSEISNIQDLSELISIRRKVLVLAQYESNLEKMPIPLIRSMFPEPFFREHSYVVKVIPKEAGKIMVQRKIYENKSTLTNLYRHFVSVISCTRNNENQHNAGDREPVNCQLSIVRQDIEPGTAVTLYRRLVPSIFRRWSGHNKFNDVELAPINQPSKSTARQKVSADTEDNRLNDIERAPVHQPSYSSARQDTDTDLWQSVSNVHGILPLRTMNQIEKWLRLIRIPRTFLSLHASVGRKISRQMDIKADQNKAV